MSGSSRKKRFMASARQKKKQQAQQRRRQQQEQEEQEQEQQQQQQTQRVAQEEEERTSSEGVASPSSSTTSSLPGIVAASSSGTTQTASASSAAAEVPDIRCAAPSTSGEAAAGGDDGGSASSGDSGPDPDAKTAPTRIPDPKGGKSGEQGSYTDEEDQKPAARPAAPTTTADDSAATKEESSPARIPLDESADADVEDNEGGPTPGSGTRATSSSPGHAKHSSFECLVQGWEATISSPLSEKGGSGGDRAAGGHRPRVQIRPSMEPLSLSPYALRESLSANRVANESATGAGSEDEDESPLRPLLFTHTQSSPLVRSGRLFESDDEEDERLGPVGGLGPQSFEGMRRSASTPSPFRHRASGSGFTLGGGGGAFSAFSQPGRDGAGGAAAAQQQPQYASYGQPPQVARSDPGFASAFDPVWFRVIPPTNFTSSAPTSGEGDEASAITSAQKEGNVAGYDGGTRTGDIPPRPSPKSSSSSLAKRSRFFPDIKALRRRRARSGRENPARPPSTSSSSLSPGVAKGARAAALVDAEEVIKQQSSSSSEEEEHREGAVAAAGCIHRETGAGPSEPDMGIVLSYSIDEEKETQEFEVTREIIGSVPATAAAQAHSRHYESLGSEDVELDANEFASRPLAASSSQGLGLPPPSPATTPRPRIDSLDSHHTPIPSPSYQKFVDPDEQPSGGGRHGAPRPPSQPGAATLLTTPPHSSSSARAGGGGAALEGIAMTPQPRFILPPKSGQGNASNLSNLSPSSHGSNSLQSRQTLNTSSQTHASTITSGTLSSNDKTATSSAEADREVREVMEATRAANRAQRKGATTGSSSAAAAAADATPALLPAPAARVTSTGGTSHAPPSVDGSASVHSVSTGGSSSAHPRAYMNLAASPGPLREGASLPVDRFFQGVSSEAPDSGGGSVGGQVSLAHSNSTATHASSSAGTGASSSGRSVTSSSAGAPLLGTPPPAARRSAAAAAKSNSPTTLSSASASAANTTASSSSGSENPPPRFVSYLDHKTPPEGAVLVTTSSPPRRAARLARVESIDEEEIEEDGGESSSSPSSTGSEGYSKLDGEDLPSPSSPPKKKKQSKKKKKKKGEKLRKWMTGSGGAAGRARPPLSPIKTPSTPPPPGAGASGESPSGGLTPQSRSPPRRIVDSLVLEEDGRNLGDNVRMVGASRPRVVRSRLPPVVPPASSSSSGEERKSGRMVLLSPSDAVEGMDGIAMTVVPPPGDDGAQEVSFAAAAPLGAPAAVVSPEGQRQRDARPLAAGDYERFAEISALEEDTENMREGEGKSGVSWATERPTGVPPSKDAEPSAVVTPDRGARFIP